MSFGKKARVFAVVVAGASIAAFSFSSCSDTATSTVSGGSANAAGAMFGSSGSQDQAQIIPRVLMKYYVRNAVAQEGGGTCDNLSGGNSGVNMLDQVKDIDSSATTLSFGSSGAQVSVTEDTMCLNDSDVANTDSTDNPLYAGYSIGSDCPSDASTAGDSRPTFTCSDGKVYVMDTGCGIWRNDGTNNVTLIYGYFGIKEGADATAAAAATSARIDCNLSMPNSQSSATMSGTCTDSGGAALTISSSITCTENS